MKLKAIVDQIQHETKVVQGDEAKDVTYTSRNTFPNDAAATEAFARSVAKLLDVNGWSTLSQFTADFALHDQAGHLKPQGPVQVGDYIRVDLPGPVPQNWVRVSHLDRQETWAEFTVQPSADPQDSKPDEIAHFFDQDARSTFRVALAGQTISAFEIGQQERINNQEPQAGERAVINTVVAEMGWLFYQKIQWKLLTDYLVHL
ncbi:hypothetical protein [Spirosoma areae]